MLSLTGQCKLAYQISFMKFISPRINCCWLPVNKHCQLFTYPLRRFLETVVGKTTYSARAKLSLVLNFSIGYVNYHEHLRNHSAYKSLSCIKYYNESDITYCIALILSYFKRFACVFFLYILMARSD